MVHPSLSTVLSFPLNTIQNPEDTFSCIVQAVHDWIQDDEKVHTSDVLDHESHRIIVSQSSYSKSSKGIGNEFALPPSKQN